MRGTRRKARALYDPLSNSVSGWIVFLGAKIQFKGWGGDRLNECSRISFFGFNEAFSNLFEK